MTEFRPLPVGFARENKLILTSEGQVFSPEAKNTSTLNKLYRVYGSYYSWVQCDALQFSQKFHEIYGDTNDSFLQQAEHRDLDILIAEEDANNPSLFNNNDAPVIRLIDSMINDACSLGASDIHVESFRHQLCVRFRIDGFLHERMNHDIRLAAPIISRLKIMAGLDIAERRLPQDGRILFSGFNSDIDIRVSVIPVIAGERVVLRILNKDSGKLVLSTFDLHPDMLADIRKLIVKPHGMLLVTGPTGSGKSTSIYAFLNEIRSHERNILTIEDPVEYQLENVGQMQVNAQSDLTFSRGLRALLRQDPDVVMIGEIRDGETASIAVQAALTGHFVFSTLHTNSAVGAITRLKDMGVEAYLIASVLSGVMAQRLVRVLCPDCKTMAPPSLALIKQFGLKANDMAWEAAGCPSCNFSGYIGRTGIFELLIVDDLVKEMINNLVPEKTIEERASSVTHGMLQDGLAKVKAGVTSLSELMRVTAM